jgi:polyribonucleotide nucleotidyltransferase
MYNAIMFGHEQNVKICEFIETIVACCGREKHSYEEHVVDHDLYEALKALVTDPRMEEAVFAEQKQDRDARISEIEAEACEKLFDQFGEGDEVAFEEKIGEAVYKY